uniref:Uncharacterized protein n=1 Tax=Panagrolaimus superbus TaxID=310955 RepID=A0A914YSL2_9BILA
MLFPVFYIIAIFGIVIMAESPARFDEIREKRDLNQISDPVAKLLADQPFAFSGREIDEKSPEIKPQSMGQRRIQIRSVELHLSDLEEASTTAMPTNDISLL